MQMWDDPPCSHDHGGCKVQPCEIHHHRVLHLHDQPWHQTWLRYTTVKAKSPMGTMEKTDPQKESKRWKWSGWFSLLNNIFKSDQILQKTFRQRVPPTEATGTPATASPSPPQPLGPSLQKDHWASWSLQNDKIMLTICSTPEKPSRYFRSTRG